MATSLAGFWSRKNFSSQAALARFPYLWCPRCRIVRISGRSRDPRCPRCGYNPSFREILRQGVYGMLAILLVLMIVWGLAHFGWLS